MKGYKGYNPGLVCRDFQYEVGKTYKTDGVKICENGFHFCENPLDVLNYYPLIQDGKLNEFTEVSTPEGAKVESEDDKTATDKITIGAKLELKGLINAAVLFIKEKGGKDARVQAASGDKAQLAASGDWAQLAASGYKAKLAASGDKAQLAASGDKAQLAASGDWAQLAASGDEAKIVSTGEKCVITNIGYRGTVSGKIGSWITLAEYDDDGVKCVKSAKIDGKKLLPDTAYQLVGGKFTKVSE